VPTFTCNLCEALCGLDVTVDGGRVTKIRGDADDVFSKGHICPKGPAMRELLEHPERLRAPMIRKGSTWKTVGWEQALDVAASKLVQIRRRHGNDAVAFYVGNPTVHSHRAAFGSQWMQAALATKNRFDPNSQDSNPRLFACMQVYGDALSMPVPDVERTDHLLIFGSNPAASNGSMMGLGDVRTRMGAIRARGGQVVLVDPRRTETMPWATSHHFIRPGGDAALLFAIIDVIFSEGLADLAAARRVASGVGGLRALAARLPAERVAAAVGIDAQTIRDIARAFARSPRACAYARVGVCQNEFGPVASWLVEALNLLTGNVDREGGAMFTTPAVDIGPLGRLLVGNHHGRWRSRVRGLPEFLGAIPSATMAEEIETPGDGQIRAMVCFAGNPVLSTPNGPRLARAIASLEHVVAIDFFLNETTRLAHVVLPPKHVFESGNFDVLLQRFAVRNVAKYSPPIVTTDDDTRDDWEILGDLALRVGAPGLSLLRPLLLRAARALPELALDVLLRTGGSGLTLAKLAASPHGVDLGPLVPTRGRNVHTEDGRARLAPSALVADVPRLERWVDAGPTEGLVLIGRRHLRSNNSWLYGMSSLVKGPRRDQLHVHPDDAARWGVKNGAAVRVTSRVGSVVATAVVTTDVMPGVVSLPHGFGTPNANALTDELAVEPIVGTSILNGVPVTIAPTA
jgi:anaerobic selenocysteine-containing dehydrogenase